MNHHDEGPGGHTGPPTRPLGWTRRPRFSSSRCGLDPPGPRTQTLPLAPPEALPLCRSLPGRRRRAAVTGSGIGRAGVAWPGRATGLDAGRGPAAEPPVTPGAGSCRRGQGPARGRRDRGCGGPGSRAGTGLVCAAAPPLCSSTTSQLGRAECLADARRLVTLPTHFISGGSTKRSL